MPAKYDFSGWATRNDLQCSDGRVIRAGAFKDQDGLTVPLVWNHMHNDPNNILGHALLENRDEGVYAYCSLNDTETGRNVRTILQHGDIDSLSIYANRLKQDGPNVRHGVIREVSLVLAGANPGACIDTIMEHSSDEGEAALIFTGEAVELYHAEEEKKEEAKMPSNSEKTIEDIFNSLTEEQKTAVYAIIGAALEDDDDDDEAQHSNNEGEEMKHNVFDNDNEQRDDVLTHSDMQTIFANAKRVGSLKEAVMDFTDGEDIIQHDDVTPVDTRTYGIRYMDYLFPDARTITPTPEFIKRDMGWVSKVMNGTHHTPFSRIKSVFANITEDEARARGYIKGHLKREEVFSLLKRATDPQTIYKKQKLDRDDVIDITDFDVVAWIKSEMRMMLEEEIARAVLVGDGRLVSDDDHISEDHVRSILNDADLYTIKVNAVSTDPKEVIKAIIRARKNYKGSGSPTFFTTEDMLTEMLLIEDEMGHTLYADEAALARKLRVKEVVTVPVMENLTVSNKPVYGIVVNLSDYNIGADKGGAVAMFDDFDIDYNQQKYLIETRISGALTKPYSAMAVFGPASNSTPSEPED